jgi:hypothetical protein
MAPLVGLLDDESLSHLLGVVKGKSKERVVLQKFFGEEDYLRSPAPDHLGTPMGFNRPLGVG